MDGMEMEMGIEIGGAEMGGVRWTEWVGKERERMKEKEYFSSSKRTVGIVSR